MHTQRIGRILSALVALLLIGSSASARVVGSSASSKDAHVPNIFSDAAHARNLWTVTVCSSRANALSIQAGFNKNDNQVYGNWQQGQGQQDYRVPDKYQGARDIFVQINRVGEDDASTQTEVCVFFNNWPTKAFHFDGQNENHEISADDTDTDCACQ